jgi:hypothetical protein
VPRRLSPWWITCILSSPILTGPSADAPRTFVSVAPVASRQGATSPSISKAADLWPKVQIRDPVTRDATTRALDGAAKWLSASPCARLFSEFHDAGGQPLDAALRQLQSTPAEYLRLVYFQDGELTQTCRRHGILAFTQVGSRVVYVCGRDFARAWNKQPREVVATLIHEMLHSLGLGENPPTPRDISDRVQKLCWQ